MRMRIRIKRVNGPVEGSLEAAFTAIRVENGARIGEAGGSNACEWAGCCGHGEFEIVVRGAET